MHIYNIKINGGKALKIIIILLSLFMLMVFLFSIYNILHKFGGNIRWKQKQKQFQNTGNILMKVL